MIDLEEVSGLPVKFDQEKNSLIFGGGVKEVRPVRRLLEEIKEVLLDKSVTSPEEFYYMYRDVYKEEDEKIIRANNLRYDLTVIPPMVVGREFIKTYGHYHPLVPETKVAYPEVYEVLLGKAQYLLQKSKPPYNEIEEIILVSALPGDKVIMPPGYGHITINPLNSPLVMSDWVSAKFSSIYKPYQELEGGAYFEILEGGEAKFIPNPKYGKIPKLKIISAKEAPALGLTKALPLYRSFFTHKDKFKFLNSPQDYLEELGSRSL